MTDAHKESVHSFMSPSLICSLGFGSMLCRLSIMAPKKRKAGQQTPAAAVASNAKSPKGPKGPQGGGGGEENSEEKAAAKPSEAKAEAKANDGMQVILLLPGAADPVACSIKQNPRDWLAEMDRVCRESKDAKAIATMAKVQAYGQSSDKYFGVGEIEHGSAFGGQTGTVYIVHGGEAELITKLGMEPNPLASKALNLYDLRGPILIYGVDEETGDSISLSVERFNKLASQKVRGRRIPDDVNVIEVGPQPVYDATTGHSTKCSKCEGAAIQPTTHGLFCVVHQTS
jgi:hypothetical protein